MHHTPSDLILDWNRSKHWRDFLRALLVLAVLLAILAARIACVMTQQ